jgi:hypothetical protein
MSISSASGSSGLIAPFSRSGPPQTGQIIQTPLKYMVDHSILFPQDQNIFISKFELHKSMDVFCLSRNRGQTLHTLLLQRGVCEPDPVCTNPVHPTFRMPPLHVRSWDGAHVACERRGPQGLCSVARGRAHMHRVGRTCVGSGHMGWHGVVGTHVPGVCVTLPLTLTLPG